MPTNSDASRRAGIRADQRETLFGAGGDGGLRETTATKAATTAAPVAGTTASDDGRGLKMGGRRGCVLRVCADVASRSGGTMYLHAVETQYRGRLKRITLVEKKER